MWSLAAPDQLNGASAVLVVAPDPERQASLAELLGQHGFRCVVPSTARAALSRLRDVSAVLVEIGTDDQEGWALCRAIRSRDKRLPLVVVSNEENRAVAGQLFGIGVDDQVPATFAPADLIARLRHRLDERREDDQLVRSYERLRNVVNEARVPLFTLRDGWLTLTNARLAELTGYDSAELARRTLHDLVVEEDRPLVTRGMQRCCEGRERFLQLPVRVIRQGGEPREMTVHLVRLPGEPGAACVGTLLDVGRSRADAPQPLSDEYFRVLVEESRDIIVVMNREGSVLYASPSVHRILGWEPAAVIGRRLLSFVHRADARPTTRLLATMLDDPASVAAARCRIRDPAGEWRVIEFTGRDILETPPVGRIVINAREVTAQQAAETALRRSEERYRHMVEGSHHIFFYSRTPEGFVYLSPSITAVLGYDPAELIRSTPDWVPQPSATPHGGSAEPDPFPRLVEARTRTGEPVTLELVESYPTAGDARAEVQGSARDVTERERLQTALRNAAFQDSLTGLPNRALFTDRLTRAILRRQRNPDSAFALLFLDLDRFKVINDSLGHGVGDRLLLAVADRLRLHLRPEDAFARFGGDEFAILLEDLPGPVDGSRVARRIVEVLAAPFEIDGFEVCTTASIGIVLGSDTGSCAESLLRNADMAMYRAKAAGGDTFELYDQPMHVAAVRRLELETELRRALDRDELQLHFQPIVRLCDSSIAGVEGLLRWDHPSKGIVAPGDFIGVAEETGYITAIGEWVLETAVAHLVEWQKNADAPDFFVSVNLSARQLHDSSLLRRVRSLLRETGIRPETLKLEITEATLLENTDRAARALRDLDALGLQIFLDDFGTGAASLNYLHRLPLHGLKIDPSFIARMHTDPRYAVLVESTMTIAKGLGLVVVAEGIEEAAQADALIGLCCDYAQGFHFAHPTPAEDLPAVIRAFGTSLEVG